MKTCARGVQPQRHESLHLLLERALGFALGSIGFRVRGSAVSGSQIPTLSHLDLPISLKQGI